MLVIGGIAYLILQGQSAPVAMPATPLQQQPTETDASWKTYTAGGEGLYGLAIQYPPTVEPIEGRALFYTASLESPYNFMPPLLNVCFASVERREFYCDFELYVFNAGKEKLYTHNDFLGFQRCAETRSRPQPIFDGIQGMEIDTCEGDVRRNAFVESGGETILLVTEPSVGYLSEKDQIFDAMITSFKQIPVE